MKNKVKSLIRKIKQFSYGTRMENRNYYDPVCGMEATGDYFLIQYQGKKYYFCSEYCKNQFEISPNEYLG